MPTSEGGTQLVFRPGTAAYTATNNIQMAPFVLNSLFAVTRGGTGTAAITVDGNALSFVPNVGNPPLVSQQTSAPLTLGFGTIGIANNSNLVFSGTGTGRVTVSGVLAGSDTAGLDMRGSYVLELTGKGDNTYAGLTVVRSGQLDLNKPDVAVPGELQIGERGSAATPVVRLLAEPGLAEDGKVVFAGPGRFDVNGKTINIESVRTLQGAAGKASVSIGAGSLTIEGDHDITHTYAGALSASGGKAPGTFVLHAPRYTLVFDNANGKGFDGTAFQGVLEVSTGILQSDGTSPMLSRFQGLPESGDLLFAVLDGIAYGFSIDYAAGDGNDIALRALSAQALPLPGTVGLLVIGLAAMIAGGALRTPRPSRGSAGAPPVA